MNRQAKAQPVMSYSRIPRCEDCQNRHHSLFVHCCQEELQSLSGSKENRVYQKEESLFKEGGKPTGLFCVYKGMVKLTKLGSSGREQIIRMVKPGDNLGSRGLITGMPYTATATALEETHVCFIPSDAFFKVVEENVDVSADLMKMVTKMLGESEERMAELALKPVRERMADTLLLLKRTYDEGQSQNGPFTIPISRDDLASLVGAAKETAIRSLSELREENIIDTRGSRITILDMNGLMRISNMYADV